MGGWAFSDVRGSRRGATAGWRRGSPRRGGPASTLSSLQGRQASSGMGSRGDRRFPGFMLLTVCEPSSPPAHEPGGRASRLKARGKLGARWAQHQTEWSPPGGTHAVRRSFVRTGKVGPAGAPAWSLEPVDVGPHRAKHPGDGGRLQCPPVVTGSSREGRGGSGTAEAGRA